jgi:hypothetical protein
MPPVLFSVLVLDGGKAQMQVPRQRTLLVVKSIRCRAFYADILSDQKVKNPDKKSGIPYNRLAVI